MTSMVWRNALGCFSQHICRKHVVVLAAALLYYLIAAAEWVYPGSPRIHGCLIHGLLVHSGGDADQPGPRNIHRYWPSLFIGKAADFDEEDYIGLDVRLHRWGDFKRLRLAVRCRDGKWIIKGGRTWTW